MQININQLARMGFNVDYNEQSQTITVYPTDSDPVTSKMLKRIAERMEFNLMEQDELSITVQKLATFSAIRKAAT